MSSSTDHYAQLLHQMVGDETAEHRADDGAIEQRSSLEDPDAWLQWWFNGGGQSRAGVIVNERTALGISAVFQAVRVLADAVASLPFFVYSGQPGDTRNRLLAHPCYRLIEKRPNPEMTPFIFRQTLMSHVLLWGNGYAEIERNRAGVPIALWPLRPDRVYPERDAASRRLVYRVYTPGKPAVTLNPEDIFHVKGLGFDGLVGYSVVALARQAMGLALATETFGASFFGNGTKTGGILKYPGRLNDVAKKNLRESIEATHGGPTNANKFMILEEGADWQQTSIPPDDAQFLQTREFQVDEIARWFNVPPHKLNDLRRATNNNVEQQSIDFVQHSLRPWLINVEEEADSKLIGDDDHDDIYAEHSVDGLLRGDSTTRYANHARAIQFGFKCVDEVRSDENLNPLPNGAGQIFLVPTNMQPAEVLDQLVKDIKLGIAPPAAATKPAPADPVKDDAATGEGDDSNRTAARSAIVRAHRPILVDALSRVVRREVEVLRRAAKRPETFRAFLGRFSGEHRGYVSQTLAPAMTAVGGSLEAVGYAKAPGVASRAVARLPEVHTQDLGEELLGIIGQCSDDQVAGRMEPVLVKWEADKAASEADAILDTLEQSL